MSMEDWYRLMDDRPGRVAGVNTAKTRNFRVGVIISSKDINSKEVQIMALTALNIIVRWTRQVIIQVPGNVKIDFPIQDFKGDFREYLERELRAVDPFSNLQLKQQIKDDECDCLLLIGNDHDEHSIRTIQINCDGWISGYALDNSLPKVNKRKDNNSIGAIFSACLGVSAIYSLALEEAVQSFAKWYSVFDMQSNDTPNGLINPMVDPDFDFGRIYQIGCGAVGSSLTKLLSQTLWKGELWLMDYDHISIHNLCSSLLFKAGDALHELKKVDCCVQALAGSKFKAIPYTKENGYDDFISEGLNIESPPDMILCLANEKNIWSTIQENYPPLTLHATTTSNKSINFGSHRPRLDWCLMCRFHKDIKHEYTPQCGESVLITKDSGEEVIGVLPYLSPMSACMIMASLGRLAVYSESFTGNSINLSFRQLPLKYLVTTTRGPLSSCPVCSRQELGFYTPEIKSSKFWIMSTK